MNRLYHHIIKIICQENLKLMLNQNLNLDHGHLVTFIEFEIKQIENEQVQQNEEKP